MTFQPDFVILPSILPNHMKDKESDEIIISATVTEALPNAMFRIIPKEGTSGQQLALGESIIAYLSGKMKLHRIKVLVGDTVSVLLDPYGGKGRIVKRM